MTSEEKIKEAIKEHVLNNKEEYIGKPYETICWNVSAWLSGISDDAINDAVYEAMDEFPSEHDPYDEAKESMIFAKYGIGI